MRRSFLLFLKLLLLFVSTEPLTHSGSSGSSGSSVVEFKDEEFVKKAILTMNKHDLNGRPLNIKEVGVDGYKTCRVFVFTVLMAKCFDMSYSCC